MIVCILGDYADNPSEENQPSYLWNCADASVINSDSTFTYNIPSGETYILPDITHVDSNGTDVVKAAQTPMVCTPNQALNISNSNDSFDVNTLVDLELPNINFTDSNGVTTSIPSMEAITASSCVAKSGLAYHRPLTTGARISYKTKDDYWQIINNDYSDAPAHPLHFVKLQAGTFDMLVDDNTFGNKNKNTDKLGGQVYTDDYCVDNLTGIGWKTTLQTAESWDDAMNTVAALSHAGFDDYYIPNQREQNTLLDYGLDNIRMINYSPFNITLNNYIWTSTTRRDASHFAHAIVPYIHSEGTRPKTSTYQYLVCRKHF
jgi:hypothetical protein